MTDQPLKMEDTDGQTQVQYYMLTVKIQVAGREGYDLVGFIKKISEVLKDYHKCTKCIYRFKVTGEAKILAVYEVTNVIGLERTLNGLAQLGYTDVVCDPICLYEDFAERIGVDAELTKPSPRNLTDNQLMWFEFNVEYPGKTMEDLISVWKTEATAALTARKSRNLELFKIAGERKVHLFFGGSAETFDDLSFKLPLMRMNGENVKIYSKALLNLDFYVKKISDD